MHIDHLQIYRSSTHCKQRHGFFCFHKIHTQFIHLLKANQCASVDIEHISLTCSVKKTDRVVIQAYNKPGEKLLLNCEIYCQGFRFICTAGNSWLTLFWGLFRSVHVSLDYVYKKRRKTGATAYVLRLTRVYIQGFENKLTWSGWMCNQISYQQTNAKMLR